MARVATELGANLHLDEPVTGLLFDGRLRYDLKLAYKHMDSVKPDKGYQGPAVVCAIYFVPIAGYIPDRPVIKYLAAQRNMEIAFAPIAGTRILVPFWLTWVPVWPVA